MALEAVDYSGPAGCDPYSGICAGDAFGFGSDIVPAAGDGLPPEAPQDQLPLDDAAWHFSYDPDEPYLTNVAHNLGWVFHPIDAFNDIANKDDAVAEATGDSPVAVLEQSSLGGTLEDLVPSAADLLPVVNPPNLLTLAAIGLGALVVADLVLFRGAGTTRALSGVERAIGVAA